MRGEHNKEAYFDEAHAGSSPLARGTRPETIQHAQACRIIPACVGNTPDWSSYPRDSGDHPRLRGEHMSLISPEMTISGSSPLARGTRLIISATVDLLRIIPACAGNTRLSGPTTRVERDHPRLRGEHQGDGRMTVPCMGSSPLARGTRTERDDQHHPAADHPRLRGEH